MEMDSDFDCSDDLFADSGSGSSSEISLFEYQYHLNSGHEQAPRRRRKSLEDQNSVLSSSMLDSKSETDFSDDNLFENIKKSGKSITDLCRNETNLSLLSSKISSAIGKEIKKKKSSPKFCIPSSKDISNDEDSGDHLEGSKTKFNVLADTFMSTNSRKLTSTPIDEGKISESELPHETDNNFRQITNLKETSQTYQNLIVSKGSKKWISDEKQSDREDDVDKLIPNRDFISRFMISNKDHSKVSQEEDENSSFLDVVDSNNPGQIPHFQEAEETPSQLHINTINQSQSFINNFYNNPNNTRLNACNGISTSASLLVEAALNSVGNMIENEDIGLKCQNNSVLNNDNNINAQIDTDVGRYGNGMNNIESLENEIKMMKNLNNFTMQIPPLPLFQSASSSLTSCNISPRTVNDNQNTNTNKKKNDIDDIESGATPSEQTMPESDGFSSHHQTPPSPNVISPGRDYTIFGSTNGGNGTTTNISSSPLPSISTARNYPEHELISPASSPAIPRYDFSNDICRKREQDERGQNHIGSQNQLSSDEENSIMAHNSTNSEEDMRIKFNSAQMDVMYSKYENDTNSGMKYANNQNLDMTDFRNNTSNDLSDIQGLDMTSRATVGSSYHHNFQLPSTTATNLGLGRYQHHIYDILTEREQQQHEQQQSHQQNTVNQIPIQPHQSLHMLPEQLSDQMHDQTTSVDLSRTASYAMSSPPPLPYVHSHHDMLRMVSLDLTPNNNMVVTNNRPFLTSQIQHNGREALDHHRLLSSAEQHRILSNSEQHRLLVDPSTHILLDQNNRLISSDQSRLLNEPAQNRHLVSSRSFGSYHQVANSNYHTRPVLPSANHHTGNPSNYHPFPAYY